MKLTTEELTELIALDSLQRPQTDDEARRAYQLYNWMDAAQEQEYYARRTPRPEPTEEPEVAASPYHWVITEPSLVTRIGESHCLVQRLDVQATQATTPETAVVVSARSLPGRDILLNGVAVDLGDDTPAFRSLLDEADYVAGVGQTYLSDPAER